MSDSWIKIGAIIFLMGFNAACTRAPQEPSKVRLLLPNSSSHALPAIQSKAISNPSAPWGQADPSTFAQINCFAIFISAPDLPGSKCVDSANATVFNAGQIAGLYAAGSEVALDVKSGANRTIRLVGFSSTANCESLTAGNLVHDVLSAPFVLGQVTRNLPPGLVTVEIHASLTGSQKFESCSGPAGSFGPLPAPVTVSPVVATLGGTPASLSNLGVLAVNVSGTDVVHYKYKLGPAGTTNCTLSTGYSASIPVANLITDSLSGFPDGALKLCVLGGDNAGGFQSLSTPTSYVWTKDTLAPIVVFATPAPGSFINQANQVAFTISGTCSDNGQSVDYSGSLSGSTPCVAGAWSATNDISALPDGSVNIDISQTDAAGNVSSVQSRSFTKDTVPPGAPTLVIDAGAATTLTTAVSLTLSSSGASEMYVTNTSGCASGGTWEPFSASRGWTLAGSSLQTVYARFRDGAGNLTTCISDSITHVVPAVLSISHGPTYDFGTVGNGGSINQSFTITNSGSSPATALSGLGLSAPYGFAGGSYPGTGGTCGATLAASATCDVVVTFSPVSSAVFNDSLEIDYHDGHQAQNTIRALTGTGASPANFALSDGPTYDFGLHAVGSAVDMTFTMTNTGAVVGTVTSSTGLAAPFGFKGGSYPGTGGTCGSTLNAGANCTLVITYSPTATGVQTDDIEIGYNNGANVVSATVGLQGVGANPAMLAISSGPTFDYGSVQVGDQVSYTFTVTNSGGFTASSMMGVGLVAPFDFLGGLYPGVGGTCGVTLAASASCSVVVAFSPQTATTFNDTLEIEYEDGVTLQMSSRDVTGQGSNPPPFTYLALGTSTTCGKRSDGSGWCWGRGNEGQLGDSSFTSTALSYAPIFGSLNWLNMDSYGFTTCGVDSANNGYCWGANSSGQIGDGTYSNRSEPTILPNAGTWNKIAVGAGHACGLHTSGSISCWGVNSNGQVGDGTTTSRTTPVTINDGGGTYIDISASGNTTCALESSGTTIKCWGNGSNGQIGNNTTTATNSTPTAAFIATGTFTQIAVGSTFTCALTSASTIKCWGAGTQGQLGDGLATSAVASAVFVNGSDWTKIVAGHSHACGLKSGLNEIYCWGLNNYGQIGDGTTVNRTAPVQLPGSWVDVFTGGSNHTCGIQANGSLWCWGDNTQGQLGDGTTIQSPFPVQAGP